MQESIIYTPFVFHMNYVSVEQDVSTWCQSESFGHLQDSQKEMNLNVNMRREKLENVTLDMYRMHRI